MWWNGAAWAAAQCVLSLDPRYGAGGLGGSATTTEFTEAICKELERS